MKPVFRSLICCFFIFCLIDTFSQAGLLPSIGLGSLPADDDSICIIPEYLGNFESTGYQKEAFVPDFQLYEINNTPFLLGQTLTLGKPVLMIAGSYTCPVFRRKIEVINEVQANYGDYIEVVVVYGVEAHPDIDISPYFGRVNTGSANIDDGILYRQPTTYGERKAIVEDMINNIQIDVPVILDGPCNEWWSHYGPAPNNGYLIDTSGLVIIKHGWFDKHPNDIICDLETYLGLDPDCVNTGNGSFIFSLDRDSIVTGLPGLTHFVHGTLSNPSIELVEIEIRRLQENVPPDWATSMCLDVCFPIDVDYTTALIEPGESIPYTMYFYTGAEPGQGNVRMGFRNINDTSNRFVQRMYASTESTTGTNQHEEKENEFYLFPNPASEIVQFRYLPLDEYFFSLLDMSGSIVNQRVIHSNEQISVSELPAGTYYFQLKSMELIHTGKLILSP